MFLEIDVFTMIVIPLLVAIVPAVITSVISFLIARYQAKKALETEIQKIKELQTFEIEKLKIQQDAEIQKLKAQQDAEMKKSSFEIEKMKTEMEKQAELYEKNAQTDVVKEAFGQMFAGNTSGFENVASAIEEMNKLQEAVDKRNGKNNHPARRKR